MIDPWERPGGAVDPEARDPGYWNRFHRRTTFMAGPELERRRRRSGETVSVVVTSWSRAIVPTAVAVAAVAALLILADTAPDSAATTPAGVGELVESALNADPIPALMSPDDEAVTVTMVDEAF